MKVINKMKPQKILDGEIEVNPYLTYSEIHIITLCY